MGRVADGFKHAWNAFFSTNDGQAYQQYYGPGAVSMGGSNPSRTRIRFGNERSIISSIYTRMSTDVASVEFKHVRLDDDQQYQENISSGLNDCLTVEANIDQSARAFRQDVAMTLFDKGVVAIVPVDTTLDPTQSGSWDIKTLRAGEIVGWFPQYVTVNLYNEAKGYREQITLPKKMVAIVENPFYTIMNEPNSTLQRLMRKLNLLDNVDELSSSGKLDLIIQFPHPIRSEARRQQAETRRKDIEFQLRGSQYGIAYTDGTEKITQLNRSIDNKLLDQVTYLQTVLYDQLGITADILNGSASADVMQNYQTRTIEPILDAIKEAMIRVFLTKTARSQGQSIMYFRNPFKLIPLNDLSDVTDVMSRNEILSPNEIRGALGMKPSSDPSANQLNNSNMPEDDTEPAGTPATEDDGSDDSGAASVVNDSLDQVDGAIDDIFSSLGIKSPPSSSEEDDDASSNG